MAKNAVRVAVRNVVKVVAVAPRPARPHREAEATAKPGRVELLSGVSWDGGRQVWLVHPAATGGND